MSPGLVDIKVMNGPRTKSSLFMSNNSVSFFLHFTADLRCLSIFSITK